MVKFSNSLVGTLNIISVLLSIPILGSGVWLTTRSAPSECETFLSKPVIAIGIFLLLVSLVGLLGSCCRNSCLLWLYLLVMFVLIVALFCFTLFAFLVTNKGAGEVVSERGYKEYRLGDYSNWLRRRVHGSGKNWARIKSCLVEGNVCQSMQMDNKTLAQFINNNLSPIQSGCCKPPTACNFTYRSETIWDKPDGFTASNISDCDTWQNEQTKLCFDCQSCKAGVLANIKHDWKKVAVINIIVLVFLVIVYTVGCCAFRNNRHANYYRRKGYA